MMRTLRGTYAQDAAWGVLMLLMQRYLGGGSSWSTAVVLGLGVFCVSAGSRWAQRREAARRAAGEPMRPSWVERAVFRTPVLMRSAVVIAVSGAAFYGLGDGSWLTTTVLSLVAFAVAGAVVLGGRPEAQTDH